MKLKKKQSDDELNFWQPAADMFSGLMLILLLIILLLALYLVNIPEERYTAMEETTAAEVDKDADGVGAVIKNPETNTGGNPEETGDGGSKRGEDGGTQEYEGNGGEEKYDGGNGAGNGGGGGSGTGIGPGEGMKSAVLL